MTPRTSSREAGFSLIELLVTALIFAIGLLGLAALQVTTLRSNSDGRNRVTAAALAEGCLGAIQSEGSLSWSYAAGLMGSGVAYTGTRPFTGNDFGTFGTFDVNGQAVDTKAATKVFQVDWVRLAATDATPKVAITGMNMNEFVVTVTWQEQSADAKGPTVVDSTLSLSRLIRY